mgnify:CR=1 FL=1
MDASAVSEIAKNRFFGAFLRVDERHLTERGNRRIDPRRFFGHENSSFRFGIPDISVKNVHNKTSRHIV